MASISIPSNLNLVQGLTASRRSRTYSTEGLGPVTYGTQPTPLSLTCPSCEKSLPLYWQTARKYKWFALRLNCQLRYDSTRTQRCPSTKDLVLNFTSRPYQPPPLLLALTPPAKKIYPLISLQLPLLCYSSS